MKKLKFDNVSSEELLGLLISLNKISADVSGISLSDAISSIQKELDERSEKPEEIEKLLNELNEVWAGEFIKIRTESLNGKVENHYYYIDEIVKDPYGNDSDVMGITTLPEIIELILEPDKVVYEVRYLDTKDLNGKAKITKLKSDIIKEQDLEKYSETKETYFTLYNQAIDSAEQYKEEAYENFT